MDYRLEQLRFELREDPSSRVFFKLGEHLRREGELDEAIEVLRAGLLEHHPRYIAAWVSLGRALLAAGDGAEAATALDRALELDPGNAVAARAAGEAAIVNQEWVKAVKALKRSRGLTPQDDALDERIKFVEDKLGELGIFEQPSSSADESPEPPPAPVATDAAADEPFAVKPAADTAEWEDANDVFAGAWVDDDDVASLTADDTPEDPTIQDTSPPEIEIEVIDEETPVFAADEALSIPEPVPEPEPAPESEPDPEPEPEPAPEPEPEPEPEDLPLQTITLARLAIEQGDLDLAEKTLRGVLETDPGNQDAGRLLESLLEAPPPPEAASGAREVADAKIRALREWLEAVRLASERLDS